ncbi:MAG: copper homeostasis protein CutC [Acidobacteriaceae bacterium]
MFFVWTRMTMVLEICVDSVESAIASQAGGAQRIELCSDLNEGGITPSAGLIQSVRKHVGIDVFVMVRPRGGDSFYTNHEYEVMKEDVLRVKDQGADGIVLGMLDQDGHVDVERTRELVRLAHPMQVTFHRAFDMSANLDESLARVIETGAHRILTSGGMQTVTQGAEQVTHLIDAAKGKIRIMVGGGIRQENIRKIALRTHATEFHCSLRIRTHSPVTFQNHSLKLGAVANDEFARYVVLEENVHGLREALNRISSGVVQGVYK